MATAFMKKNHATVWVPPRTVGERAFAADALLWTARMQGAGKVAPIERNSLDSLTGLKSVNLIFDARDVSLLSAQLPPLPPAKLQRALPNIIEEQILQDVGSCAFAVGGVSRDTEKLIAVIDKAWLEFVLGAFERRGLWVTAAWPAQLTLPMEAESWALLCVNDGIAVRTGPVTGLGWVGAADPTGRAEALEAALNAAANGRPLQRELTVYCEDASWTTSVEATASKLNLELSISGLQATRTCAVNLLDGRPSTASQRWIGNIDWRAWRLPLGLAAACLLAFLVGLNVHWAQLVRERSSLKAGLERKFQQTFPNIPVIVDPMLQMQRQVATLRSRSGQSAPEDFGPLLAKLPAALGGRNDAVAGVEYREGRLRMRFSPSFVESRASRDSLTDAFRRQGLLLKFDAEGQATASVSLVS
jgi:general secretion pathway protein L